MDTIRVSEAIGIKPDELKGSLKEGEIQELSYGGLNYLRLREKVGDAESGTAIFLNPFKPIPAFPKIRRAIILEATLRKHFSSFAIEEKLDGYNIRIARVGKELVGISRGGLVCPYSTSLLRNKPEIAKFLVENDTTLCCELVGEESPYVSHDYPESHKLDYFIFDIIRDGNSIPIRERQELCTKFGLNQVRNLGDFDGPAMEKIWEILHMLQSEDREGIVIKSHDMKTQMKYTLSNANIAEINFAFQFPFDSGIEFFFRRFIREAFQSYELGESDTELRKRAQELGLSILQPLRDSIGKVSGGEKLTYDSEIEGDQETLKGFVEHLEGLGIKFEHEFHGNKLMIKRMHQASHDKIRNYLGGEFASD